MSSVKSSIWNYYGDVKKDKAACKTCEVQISCKGGTTSSLINHLKQHKEVHEEYLKVKNKRAAKSAPNGQPPSKQSRLDQFVPSSSVESLQKKVDDAIVEFLAESNSAFRIVDLESFKNMFSCINKKIKVKGRTFYSNLVTQKSDEMRKDLLSILDFMKNDIVTVSFTTDLWTSVNSDPYISLTLHFISKEWNLYRFCPYVKPFPQRHTGKNIKICLDAMIEELGLHELDIKLVSVNDNASNMKLGIRLSNYLEEYNCDIHTLELVIRDGVVNTPGMVDLLKKNKKNC